MKDKKIEYSVDESGDKLFNTLYRDDGVFIFFSTDNLDYRIYVENGNSSW